MISGLPMSNGADVHGLKWQSLLQGGVRWTLEWTQAQVGQTGSALMSSGGNCKLRQSTAGASITELRDSVAAVDILYRYTVPCLSGRLRLGWCQCELCSEPLSVGRAAQPSSLMLLPRSPGFPGVLLSADEFRATSADPLRGCGY